MLKRIYVNNFRCLVNFELTFDNINLILGYNGSGKSTLFDIFVKLQNFIVAEYKVENIFKHQDLTRWQTSNIQSFELEFLMNSKILKYSLEIEYSDTSQKPRILKESFVGDDEVEFRFSANISENPLFGELRIVQSPNSNFNETKFPSVSSSRSVFSFVDATGQIGANWFKQKLFSFFVAHINPNSMNSESRGDKEHPRRDFSDFSAWYSHLSLSEQGKIIKLTLELQKVLVGFDSFQNTKIGNARILSALFDKPSKASYQFDELSSGQKVLIALYTLLYCTPENCTLIIDEPENFLALPEILPWVSKLIDRCQEDDVQAILISHHPSLINELATEYGCWFERQDNQAVRVQKIVDEGEEGGLSIAKLIEMRWIYDQ